MNVDPVELSRNRIKFLHAFPSFCEYFPRILEGEGKHIQLLTYAKMNCQVFHSPWPFETPSLRGAASAYYISIS